MLTKQAGTLIEAMSKALTHSDTITTKTYCIYVYNNFFKIDLII